MCIQSSIPDRYDVLDCPQAVSSLNALSGIPEKPMGDSAVEAAAQEIHNELEFPESRGDPSPRYAYKGWRILAKPVKGTRFSLLAWYQVESSQRKVEVKDYALVSPGDPPFDRL
jgi:hypothetical protein